MHKASRAGFDDHIRHGVRDDHIRHGVRDAVRDDEAEGEAELDELALRPAPHATTATA
ncbi:hypothetical protein ABZ519_09265 [Streptomyces collinus]|uniref:hypothetical protein n=1 Tax=Streptomyces collinus TaxID=42684 RepID=UPI0033F1A1AB